jgi:hypothetical protein
LAPAKNQHAKAKTRFYLYSQNHTHKRLILTRDVLPLACWQFLPSNPAILPDCGRPSMARKEALNSAS